MSEAQGPRRRRKGASVDCEKCQHFTGRQGWIRVEWGCAKGHAAESTIVLTRREGCPDYRECPRDELIFRRFEGSASFSGNADLKNRQTQATRTANGLDKALADFGDLMDGQQVQAGRDAVAALRRLAADIARASELASRFKAREDARREAEHAQRLDALAARHLAGWSEVQVIECAEHLAAFDTSAAWKWLNARHGRDVLTASGLWSSNEVAQRLKRAQGAARTSLFADLRRQVAEALEEFERSQGPQYASRGDFDAYRQLLRDQRAAKASVAALVAGAAQLPPDSDST